MLVTWEIVGIMCTVLTMIVGAAGAWINSLIKAETLKRNADTALIMSGQDAIRDSVKNIEDETEKRLDRLETQSRDYRPGSAIDTAMEHNKRNLQSMIEGVKLEGEKNAIAISTLRDKVVTLETKHEGVERTVSEIKSDLKETRHEINDRFDQQQKLQQSQFDQLCKSIREISERKAKD